MTKAEIEALLNHLGVEEKDVLALNFDNTAKACFHKERPFSLSKIVNIAGVDWYIDNEMDNHYHPYFICQPLSNVQGIMVAHPQYSVNVYDMRSVVG